jgi:3-isopropylmalate dehydrogenase
MPTPDASKTAGKILVLSGDHIGPEVVAEALKVLDVIEAHKGVKFEREYDLCGGCSLDKHGTAATDEVLEKSVQADAVFFGSAGGPEWGTSVPNPESGLLRIRLKMQVRGDGFQRSTA